MAQAFGINHMTAPGLRYDALLDLAVSVGAVGVEFRNDLSAPLFDGHAPAIVADAARSRGMRILALAEVKSFNDYGPAKEDEAKALIAIAKACGAEAVALIPRNDGWGVDVPRDNLQRALDGLLPLLRDAGLIGLVEPLGFAVSSLRHKSDAVTVIDAMGAGDTIRLVHDTFHHALAGGGAFHAAQTGLVHISGVTDPGPAFDDMTDAHRVLVDGDDRLGNIAQIATLRADGYTGPLSFEPFSPLVHDLADAAPALRASMAFITAGLSQRAA
ncbi:MAG: TIM barrel protein [Alphaproteobacteria bacterium]|nr:TIM barrel protein [Alphaproteobacteria bacterium]